MKNRKERQSHKKRHSELIMNTSIKKVPSYDYDKSGVSKDTANVSNLFKKFCNSSTIHGTFFWSEDIGPYLKTFWIGIVVLGIGSAGWIINNSFKAWEETPVITSVAQLSIEEIPFPSITICPLDTTPFGFVERVINESPNPNFSVRKILFDALWALRKSFDGKDCLYNYCSQNSSDSSLNCPVERISEFKEVRSSFKAMNHYEEGVRNRIWEHIGEKILPGKGKTKSVRTEDNFEGKKEGNCTDMVKDFIFFEELQRRFSSMDENSIHPGKLLKWLYYYTESLEERKKILDNYVDPKVYPKTSGLYFGTSMNISFPELVEILEGETAYNEEDIDLGRHFGFSSSLLEAMRSSIHPPHVFEEGTAYPDPAFLMCKYPEYQERPEKESTEYCESFQTTLNEEGLCYSYNNIPLGLENDNKLPEFFRIRSVQGCGKDKGLQIALDRHKLMSHSQKNNNRGFKIFITRNGVVTHKVPFTVDTTFYGEYNFHLHGIHIITSSEEFRKWNEEKKICYYNQDKKLAYFSSYTQNNCLLECKLNKTSRACGCFPWYLNQMELPVCTAKGFRCFRRRIRNYNEDLKDRVECKCKTDCEMVHFFSSQTKFPFSDLLETDYKYWYDKETQTGRLADYLIDSQNIISDPLTRNLSKFVIGVKSDDEYAQKRFEKDIAILNFFFDTPIITEIRLQMKITIFDQISAIGGTLGLFTGVSLVTFVEILYWGVHFIIAIFFKTMDKNSVQAFSGSSPRLNYVSSYSN